MELIKQAKKNLEQLIFCKEDVLDLLFIALLTQGHVLLESVPGTGKTRLAKSFAKMINGTFSRIQFTSDVLPSDITGIRYFNPKIQEFELRLGPIHTNILLADEINRATPRTQSSLLEAMEEFQATIDGETITIPRPFMIIATQNPIEQSYGTFPLPEAQLDRFLFKIDLGYPSKTEDKLLLLSHAQNDPFEAIKPLLSLEDIKLLQDEIKNITISDVVYDYIVNLIHCSREHNDVELGISPRGMLALMRASQARACLENRDYVTPEDVKFLMPYLFEHRLILTMEGEIKKTPQQIIKEINQEVTVAVEYGVKQI